MNSARPDLSELIDALAELLLAEYDAQQRAEAAAPKADEPNES